MADSDLDHSLDYLSLTEVRSWRSRDWQTNDEPNQRQPDQQQQPAEEATVEDASREVMEMEHQVGEEVACRLNVKSKPRHGELSGRLDVLDFHEEDNILHEELS